MIKSIFLNALTKYIIGVIILKTAHTITKWILPEPKNTLAKGNAAKVPMCRILRQYSVSKNLTNTCSDNNNKIAITDIIVKYP